MKAESLTKNSSDPQRDRQIVEAIRNACLRAAQQGYERAAADGLYNEGALEVALDAIRSLDVDQILRELNTKRGSEE